MSSQAARYDGNAEWYDETFSAFHPPGEELAFLRQALGMGDGEICIDLACGTGLCVQPIVDAGYQAVGFDISADQLRFARRRMANVVQADACNLPLPGETVSVMVGMFFHTDLEDFAAAARQVARCLRPRGRFIYAGLHPCFIGPFVNRTTESAEQQLHFSPGYGSIGWASHASGDGSRVRGSTMRCRAARRHRLPPPGAVYWARCAKFMPKTRTSSAGSSANPTCR
jgi:SAM-dependent methyltransferase